MTTPPSPTQRLETLWEIVQTLNNGQRSVVICRLFGRLSFLAKNESDAISSLVLESLEASIESAKDANTPAWERRDGAPHC